MYSLTDNNVAIVPMEGQCSISHLLAIVFHRNINITELTNTNRLKKLFFRSHISMEQNIQVQKNGEMGHFSDPGPHRSTCVTRALLAARIPAGVTLMSPNVVCPVRGWYLSRYFTPKYPVAPLLFFYFSLSFFSLCLSYSHFQQSD